MDSYDNLPDKKIVSKGEMSKKFLSLGIDSFKEACLYVHDQEYGYNSDYSDHMIFFKEGKGSCTSKHAVIAALADELEIPLYKKVAIYELTEDITDGAGKIIKKYGIPYIPMQHCFLVYKDYRFDLTEGNNNGKKTSIDEFIHTEKVNPFISKKDEYLILKKVLKEKILTSEKMKNIDEKTLLKAREEGIKLLKKNIK
ncbi:MAG: hypothetical protein GF317_03840 [Candidatus Lokiarchaeota archaeon]|nr:hypothetical protein [Candidatus Lokiarchaeota archaeon]MBD3199018.1 hypothetical protein [Candidatus Lokiarchaeota archaeon]